MGEMEREIDMAHTNTHHICMTSAWCRASCVRFCICKCVHAHTHACDTFARAQHIMRACEDGDYEGRAAYFHSAVCQAAETAAAAAWVCVCESVLCQQFLSRVLSNS